MTSVAAFKTGVSIQWNRSHTEMDQKKVWMVKRERAQITLKDFRNENEKKKKKKTQDTELQEFPSHGERPDSVSYSVSNSL